MLLFLVMSSVSDSKEYPGYKADMYLKKSKEERDKICSHMEKAYEEARNKKCHSALNTDTGQTNCLSGRKLEAIIKQRQKDYEFTCQI